MSSNKGFSLSLIVSVMLISSLIVLSCVALVTMNSKSKVKVSGHDYIIQQADGVVTTLKDRFTEDSRDVFKDTYQTMIEGSSTVPYTELDSEFCKMYFNRLMCKILGVATPDSYSLSVTKIGGSEVFDYLTAILDNTYPDNSYNTVGSYIYLNSNYMDKAFICSIDNEKCSLSFDCSKKEFRLNNIQVDVRGNSLSRLVRTDFVLKMPDTFIENPDVSLSSSEKASSLSDFCLVADGDINILNNNDVTGSIYSGGNLSVGKTGISSLTIDANKIISRGDVIIYTQSCANIESENFYAHNLITAKKGYKGSPVDDSLSNYNSLVIDGNIYLDGDTIVGSNNGDVILRGSYFGYNDSDSAFCINAVNSNVDLGGLNQFWLSGLSHIGIQYSKDSRGSYVTGDSLASKFMQTMYLVPDECISDDSNRHTNPIIGGTDVRVNLKSYKALDLTKYVNPELPYRCVSIKTEDYDSVYYFYLNFKNTKSAIEYSNDYYKVNKKLSETRLSACNVGNILIDDTCLLKTKGNVISFDGGRLDIKSSGIISDTSIDFTSKKKELGLKYRSLCSTLDENVTSSLNTSCFNYLVNNSALTSLDTIEDYDKFTFSVDSGSVKYYAELDGRQFILVDGDVTINKDFSGVVIATGNINIFGSVDVDGCLLSGNDINISSSSRFRSSDAVLDLVDYTNVFDDSSVNRVSELIVDYANYSVN